MICIGGFDCTRNERHAMKKYVVLALVAAMFLSPVFSTAAAFEPLRLQDSLGQGREEFEGRRGRSSRRRGGRYYRGSSSGAWVAAGILGAAVIGSAIASSKASKREREYYAAPTYVYQQPAYVYEQQPTYVYQQPGAVVVQPGQSYGQTYVDQSGGAVVVDPNVYTYDANGNLVPYYGQ